jgi:hypothetical protein
MPARLFFPIAIALLLAACAGPRVEILSQTQTFPPTTEVEILLDPPKRAHKSFAILEDWAGGSSAEINERFKQKGRELGADAILITSINDKTVTDWILVDPCYDYRVYCGPRYRPVRHSYRSVRAKALKYLPSP